MKISLRVIFHFHIDMKGMSTWRKTLSLFDWKLFSFEYLPYKLTFGVG